MEKWKGSESYREWRTLAQKTLSAQSARYFSLLMNPAGGAPLEKHFYFCRSVYQTDRQTDGRTDRQKDRETDSSQWPFFVDSVMDSLEYGERGGALFVQEKAERRECRAKGSGISTGIRR